MPGFKDSSINTAIENKIFNYIVSHLLNCCLEMKSDCLKTGSYLFNHEDKITNRLVVNYLNKGANIVRFEIQAPENYDERRDEFVGRTDIKVRSINWFLGNSDDYYIIECKRIDGSKELRQHRAISEKGRMFSA